MTNNPKVRVHFIQRPRYVLRSDTGYRARRPVVVALAVVTAAAMLIGGLVTLLWLVNL